MFGHGNIGEVFLLLGKGRKEVKYVGWVFESGKNSAVLKMRKSDLKLGSRKIVA